MMRRYITSILFCQYCPKISLLYNDFMAKEPQLYEIGLLIKPDLSETEASTELGNVRLEIEKHNGILESTTDPKPRKLAYPIKKITQAYFAALQFSVSPASITAIEKSVSTRANILRSLVLSWTRAPAQHVLKKPIRAKMSETPILYSPAKTEEVGKKVDEKELDKRLDEILGQ